MMVCFSCPQDVKKHLDRLVEDGQYSDYSEVLCAAVRNLAVLHVEVDPRGAVVVAGGPEAHESQSAVTEDALAEKVFIKPPSSKVGRRAGRRKTRARASSPKRAARSESVSVPVELPTLFRALEHGPIEGLVAPTPDDVWRAGQTVPIERWIFGQFNRLLPAKASCRAIANSSAANDKRKPDELASAIAKEAAALGAYLRQIDASVDRGRDENFSTAFPGAGQSEEKGVLRYASQFVVSTNSNGQLSGLLVSLKLINRLKGPRSPIGLTEAGWAFAALKNPVLDQAESQVASRFSGEEVQFLVEHIGNHVPAERFAYRSILEAVEAGRTSPDALDEALSEHSSTNQDRETSSSFLSSQRSGAVSRMSDLGLIERCRTGVRVEYAVTELGRKFLAKTSTLEGK